ncbi:ThiF family adenylyltransferase [Streptomyces sp. LUP30]|uniref:ThiF family adenylyltransferase n=1 Tax=Streptomyces sp. LUP30 TaxID=1890285 RepID=UPI00159F2F41|nr:ThiF family adenylyltransferase [Streptomyces sp. LUP30]
MTDAIRERLCSVRPERGGALLVCGRLIHLFVEDTHGRYSAASWDISAQLSQTVGILERAGHGRLTGTVHTHPAGVPDPSPTDIRSTKKMLEINPHLDQMLIAVVTSGSPRALDVDLGAGFRMSLHVLRRHGPGHELERVPGTTVPLTADLAAAGVELPAATAVRRWVAGKHDPTPPGDSLPSVLRVNHRARLVVPVPSDRAGALLIDADYPDVGPLAVAWESAGDGAARQLTPLPSPWDPTTPTVSQLAALARTAAGRHVDGSADRVWPLVGNLADRHVVVAGLGSVGSRIAEDLVRCGIGTVTVIDPENVEAPNLARTVYTAADLGLSKPSAIARRLRAIDPAVQVTEHVEALGALNLADVLSGADLVVGAIDDMEEQALLSHHAYAARIPMVACALYRAAAAGEVVISVPEADTPCWNCSVGTATASTSLRPEHDYGLEGRLVGEAALGPAIHLVACCASSAAIGLLAGPSSPAGEPLRRLIEKRRTLGVVATSPRWGFFPDLVPELTQPHQHAPQSLWAIPGRDPDCPACGAPDKRKEPLTAAEGEALAELLNTLDLEEETAADAPMTLEPAELPHDVRTEEEQEADSAEQTRRAS